jgi:hypothetical protein
MPSTTMATTRCTGRCARAFRDAKFARGPLAALYERLAPASIDVNTGERLVRLDRHLSEYFLFQTLWVLFKSRFTHRQRRSQRRLRGAGHPRRLAAPAGQHRPPGTQQAPASVERPGAQRNRPRLRLQPGAVHARHQGWYQFNPKLAVRRRQGDDESGCRSCGAQPAADQRGHEVIRANAARVDRNPRRRRYSPLAIMRWFSLAQPL